MSFDRWDHHPSFLSKVLSEHPTYRKVLDTYFKLFGTQDTAIAKVPLSRQTRSGNYKEIPTLPQFLARNSGLPYEEICEAYRWLTDAGLLEVTDQEGVGGSTGYLVRLREWDIIYVPPDIRDQKPKMTRWREGERIFSP